MDRETLPTNIRAYHRRTKHAPGRYALGPAFLDWTSQPSPYRRFAGAPLLPLPLTAAAPAADAGAPVNWESLGLFLELALGLSAWKSVEGETWALRNNPSSGNLHPTEAYLLMNGQGAQTAGLYHYAPLEHALERRASFERAEILPHGGFLLALTSLAWREAWKYGERAFRYCQLDVGHAVGAIAQAAAANGWPAHMLADPSDDELGALLGLERDDAWRRREEERVDVALWIGADAPTDALDLAALLREKRVFAGVANQLSEEHDGWPAVDDAARFCHKPRLRVAPRAAAAAAPLPTQDIADVVRRRRSAQRMDGAATLPRADFARLLAALAPDAAPLMSAFAFPPAIALALFVHRVDGLAPGLYLAPRDPLLEARLRPALSPAFEWAPVDAAGAQLLRLQAGGYEKQATLLSCQQPIAGKGCFAVAMIADFDRVLDAEGDFAYRRLHWEAGLIGQAFYLWATALGLSGTGIGCFFDDETHRLLGLAPGDTQFQVLYHFTVGGAVEDTRILTLPAYPAERWRQP